jgi:dTDP-4-dehydrorhamnose reductase
MSHNRANTSRKRMVVTGRHGQIVSSLLERGQDDRRFAIIALGRPELDLSAPDTIDAALRRARPDVIVSAAAYTAVDRAETDEEAAMVINAVGAGRIAETAAALGVPLVHLSTDYVFDGAKPSPYIESDPVAPLGAYGRSKLAGERAVADAAPNHVVLRTAWVYGPFGKNFLKTMLSLAERRDSVNVIGDQIGNPTCALDIADGILAVAANLMASQDFALRGVFHMTARGEASWADFAEEIFARSAMAGRAAARVDRISSSMYPTQARRPANSRLDCGLIENRHGIRLPDWRQSTASTVARLARTWDREGCA